MINLPIGLEVLELKTVHCLDSSAMRERRCTLREAASLCNAMSIHCPGMKELTVVKYGFDCFKFSWLKKEGSGWLPSLWKGSGEALQDLWNSDSP